MADELKLTTTGTAGSITLTDLGKRVITHPTTDLNLLEEFTVNELVQSQDLKDALSSGYITLTDWNEVSIPAGSVDDLSHDAQKIMGVPCVAPAGIVDAGKLWGYDHDTGQMKLSEAALTSEEPPDATSASIGSIWFDSATNLQFIWDASRQKWLANHNVLTFSRTSGNGTYMNISGGAARGYKMTSNLTIIAAHVWYASGTDGKSFFIHINGSSVHEMVTSGLDYTDYTLNIDFDTEDEIQVYIGSGGAIGNAVCVVETAFRYDFV